jgi:hypothetical protein
VISCFNCRLAAASFTAHWRGGVTGLAELFSMAFGEEFTG